jgi:2-haloacid dehalogenase
MNIKNIIFDFGGVLLDWNPRYLYNNLFDDKEQMEYFLTNVCSESWNVQQDAGRSLVEATKLLQQQFPEHQLMIQRFYDDWEIMLKGEIPENTVLIEQLKKKNYRLFGLTNWSGETFPIALKKYMFLHEFEGIVVSGDEKLIKPDKEIYLVLLNRYKLKAENSIFIDDNINNIKTASHLGFHTIHINGNLNLEHRFKELGIL